MYDPEELTEDRKKTYDLIWKSMLFGLPVIIILLIVCVANSY